MNKEKIQKIICLTLTVLVCLSMTAMVFATDILGGNQNVTPQLDSTEMSTWVGDVLGIIQYICWALAIGMLLYLGIRYLMSAANERAELKNSSIRYVIGALMIASGSTVFAALWEVFHVTN